MIGGIISITKFDNESYEDRVKRAVDNKYGKIIKPADIADNSEETRLQRLPKGRAEELRQKYNKAKVIIREATGKTS